MPEECPHLSYRTEADGTSFDVARAFCGVTESFVQPMRADVCNARYGLEPASDCEFYVDPTDGADGVDGVGAGADRSDASTGADRSDASTGADR